ncbi:P-loop containing nucleoside triphosphate hydrolase protein [Boletus coccyginus]|nr:P-loop containing nucleoside triphosphate hydrolase protein [Boletus coccyginus]
MLTVKLVVIGASGVGKTSFRSQYISGRFSTGYRATIGADFIAKTLPHPTKPDEVVTLQIWDTAGQERFSSLSTAFFRGADAALLMFDVNQPETLTALKKWWEEFRERAPLCDGDLEDYCCIVVGNKTDLVDSNALSSTSIVSEEQAFRFLDDLVPPSSPRSSSPIEYVPITIEEAASEEPASPHDNFNIDLSSSSSQLRSQSIDINQYVHRGHSKRSSWSSANINNGTLTSTHTGVTSYHTPSSSLFDAYASARSSPFPPSVSSRLSSPIRTKRRASSASSTSSARTITPSLFTRNHNQAAATTPTAQTVSSHTLDTISHHPLLPERGPKLFFTSAKTGEGVHEVFEYIARRVVTRWEYEEAIDARTLRVQEPSETIRLVLTRESNRRLTGSCC